MFVGADDNMADSFCLIPSKSEPSSMTLKKENIALKGELEEAQKQLAAANKILRQRQEHDIQLRDSIMLARKEVVNVSHFMHVALMCPHTEQICSRRSAP